MGLVRIAGYPMDLSISENHTFPGEATKFPVEAGADVSDHIRDLPPEITLECLVSDTVPSQVASDPARGQTVTTPDGEIQFVLPREEALTKLREIKALRKPVPIETSIGVFESMAFISLDVPVDKDKNNAVWFTAKFQKFNQVVNARVRTRSNIAGDGRTKAVAPNAYKIVRKLKWYHGDPPGAPWRFPNPIEIVSVAYAKPGGVPSNQVAGLLDETLRYEEIGYRNGILKFFDTAGVEIIADRRNALRLDLLRDRRDMDAARARDPGSLDNDPRFGPDGQLLPKFRTNVPPGIDTSRLPSAPTTGAVTRTLPRGPSVEG